MFDSDYSNSVLQTNKKHVLSSSAMTLVHNNDCLIYNKTNVIILYLIFPIQYNIICLPKSGLNRLVPEGMIDKCNSNSKRGYESIVSLS